ncbi:hypothetical protein Rsub_10663 [Raphidocelis subcapitata]|uniref:RPA-interacting protein C-terminal domain-containing protein n=1 Tax=Raphidocelis subcapitata TaxID=307507 RepID=A0A2V0PEP6_9CHLO|nr:hypothetical protein Rsub_10663 [Raphidocelis subcapitata]|eukprot:GBF97989.1 hypothetical protein Rsub_10663 [Raphidocelis subcapitata]
METEPCSTSASAGHRNSVKHGSGGNWRDKLREDCRRLVRERRQQTLQRHRHSLSPVSAAQLQSALQADVHAAVKDLALGIQRSPLAAGGGSFGAGPRGDGGGSGGGQGGGGGAGPPAAGDVDAFLSELESELVGEMLRELEQLEAFEAAALASAVAEREALVAAGGACSPSHACDGPSQDSSLLCPVCMGAFLLQRAGVVVCPRGCVRLNLAAESLSLRDLRARLGEVYEEHGGTGCGGPLAFRCEELFGSRSLSGACSAGCGFYRIVA